MSRTKRSGFLTLTLLLAALSFGATAPDDDEELVRISGVVTVGEDPVPLAGARVEALEEGVFSRASATTDEQGRYRLEVPTGFYDLRVLADRPGHVAAFARELDLRTRTPRVEDLRLRELEPAIRDCGFELEELLDKDLDAIPDLLEGPAHLDPKKGDTSEDGVYDGLATWVDADPLLGPAPIKAWPGLLWPPEEGTLPLPLVPSGATPPIELLFTTVPGATGYSLRVFSTSVRAEEVRQLDFLDGELLVGEAAAVRWVPPAGWESGEYAVELQAWYEAPDRTVGQTKRAKLLLFEVEEPEPIEIAEEARLSGVHVGSTIDLREGAKVIVPAGETLYLFATEDVTIDRLATLVGESGEPTERQKKRLRGGSVMIYTAGDLLAMGPIVAGDGARGEDVGVVGAQPQTAKAGSGFPGGDVMIAALGTVTVGREAYIASGRGGDGGEAHASGEPGKDALAEGGHGGRGGRLLVHASALQVADRPGILDCGTGGNGGVAQARGGDGSSDVQAGLSTVLPGVGGDSGSIWLCDWDLRRDGFVALADESFPVRGGYAGAVGAARPYYGSPGTFDGSRSHEGRAHGVTASLPGGRGWMRAGDGQPAVARGGEGLGTGSGGKAVARAGPGGDVSKLGIPVGAFRLTFGYLPTGGAGGAATAQGGVGGEGALMGPGDGGSAEATAGDGGLGLARPLWLLSAGGAGGDARAIAASGSDGQPRCPGRGQDGSDGGTASATGGDGGFADYLGGNGGAALASGGDGGDGGMGHGGGRGGSGGWHVSHGGDEGGSFAHLGAKGNPGGGPGSRGDRGPLCPN